ncbi:methionyl-tRNA formyltransferase [Aspergillus mulundensis]|uniref:Formyl transferase C-terminal domain-containing protein n=1 Tax=Aspergillus mulundensis TaxID=1810919 RepID=A0A3D8QEV5_9EURO|nr:hypothetical protein DSM5745_10801 [Aspergillus mulundensis]RDW60343.1 hypothetical protein DSM5745_10801 [Aspergillus mulundensis]
MALINPFACKLMVLAPRVPRRTHQSDSGRVVWAFCAATDPQWCQIRWHKRPSVVTSRTLHLKHFDHGTILAQTPSPGFEIPNPDSCTVAELLDIVASKGAELLLEGIREGLFVPPVKDAGWYSTQQKDLIHATKITPEDKHIDWATWTWADVSRRERVLGPLWSKSLVLGESSGPTPSFEQRRVILSEFEEVRPLNESEVFAVVPGLPFIDGEHTVKSDAKKGVYVFTKDRKLVRIHSMKVEGRPNTDAFRAALKARMIGSHTFSWNNASFTPFHNPLS